MEMLILLSSSVGGKTDDILGNGCTGDTGDGCIRKYGSPWVTANSS
jgi:hypothetical protein